jgi:hypothetical protein
MGVDGAKRVNEHLSATSGFKHKQALPKQTFGEAFPFTSRSMPDVDATYADFW